MRGRLREGRLGKGEVQYDGIGDSKIAPTFRKYV